MFKKILIANRGEIACRIIKTAKLLGIKTVAVFSDADADSLHVQQADEAVYIGPSPATESYLRGETIINAALQTGAAAIHPGYGFLSENPEFVESVQKAKLKFIGPSAAAIRAMGLKDAAKALMEKSGVPVVPGYHGSNQDPEHLKQEASRIGYPVLIKARAGGGGKGMRLVEHEHDFFASLESAAREGQNAFGDPAVLIEKYITSPRHIEMQVIGDAQGNVIHLFERDCSLQRRHQKVIEEAPAPDMPEAVRKAMTDAAICAARAIGYENAGTIEFIADGNGPLRQDSFWFMEMNTRLQVEHPVTEAITGVDLVELQLQIAAGEPLPLKQSDIEIKGHAFEARLYAENVPDGFLPATGTLNHIKFSDDARIDTGVQSGSEITSFYDPMIAKVVTHGATRKQALDALDLALRETHAAGLATNRDFLLALARHEAFLKGQHDTGLIDRDLEALIRPEYSEMHDTLLVGLIALEIQVDDPLANWRLWGNVEYLLQLVQENQTPQKHRIQFSSDSATIIRPDDVSLSIKNFIMGRGRLSFSIDGTTQSADYFRWTENGATHISLLRNGRIVRFTMPDPLDRGESKAIGGTSVVAPMSGTIVSIDVSVGDTIATGDRLAVIEAMKMEIAVCAERDGVIGSIAIEANSAVEGGTTIISFEDETDE